MSTTVQKNDLFFMEEFRDEDYVNAMLEEAGFNLDYTTWIYSWTVPAWLGSAKREEIKQKLSDSGYRHYLITVREDTPV